MMQFDRVMLGKSAKELGFVRDTLEKVCRLADVLKFMEEDEVLSECLALKGGTAINLTIFNLPRLSVDIDMDYSRNTGRDTMLHDREDVTTRISKYMSANGYLLSPKSKNYHALDSFVYEYVNAGGGKDNLKIEINYMLRCHVLPVARRKVALPWNNDELTVLSVDPLEIFSSKTVALLNRTAPRDLYDMHNMVRYGLFDEEQENMLRKCVVFYSAVGSETPPENFNLSNIGNVSAQKIKTDLNPVLRRGERFDLDVVQKEVSTYLDDILKPTKEEILFWEEFRKGNYRPDLIFGQSEHCDNVNEHPMALWKCQKNSDEIDEIMKVSHIQSLIYVIRGQQVMLDSDLAILYQVETKTFNQAVKRNIERFPENFMFQLKKEEYESLRSQIVTSKEGRGGRRYLPYVFTEQGIAMLSAVLRSEIAVQVSIKIMETFVEIRKYMANTSLLYDRMNAMEERQITYQNETNEKFDKVFAYISDHEESQQKIFFDGQIYDAFSLLIDLVGSATKSIVLVDNYVDVGTLNILSKKKENVAVTIYTVKKTRLSEKDVETFNQQYPKLEVNCTGVFHDRFLIIDDEKAYHIGASLKDAGKKCFAISLLNDSGVIYDILQRLDIETEENDS